MWRDGFKINRGTKNILMSTEVNFVEKNAWVQKAMVAKIMIREIN